MYSGITRVGQANRAARTRFNMLERVSVALTAWIANICCVYHNILM